MSPKMGRPTTNPKKHDTRIRMSDEDVQLLELCCKKTGMTKADVIRKGIRMLYESLEKNKFPPDDLHSVGENFIDTRGLPLANLIIPNRAASYKRNKRIYVNILDVLSFTSGGIENVLQLLSVFQDWFEESHKTDLIDRSHSENDISLLWNEAPNYESVFQAAVLDLTRIRNDLENEIKKEPVK